MDLKRQAERVYWEIDSNVGRAFLRGMWGFRWCWGEKKEVSCGGGRGGVTLEVEDQVVEAGVVAGVGAGFHLLVDQGGQGGQEDQWVQWDQWDRLLH